MARVMSEAWYALRFKILKRDNFTCQYCGQHAPNVVLHVDHIKEYAEGGTDDEDNLTTACAACNIGKEGLRASANGKTRKRRAGSPGSNNARIVALLEEGPLSALSIAERLNLSDGTTRVVLGRLLAAGKVVKHKKGNDLAKWALRG